LDRDTVLYLLSQLAGLLGVLSSVVIYQQKKRKYVLLWKLISDTFWVIHFVILGINGGSFTGAAVSLIAIIRSLVFFAYYKKERVAPKLVLIGFMALSAVLSILTWKNIFSLFAMSASLLAIISFWQSKPKNTVYFSFPIAACMITYQLSLHSVIGAANEAFIIVSSAVSLIRRRIENKKAGEIKNG